MSIPRPRKKFAIAIIGLALVALAGWGVMHWQAPSPGEGFISGNGRIEATEIDVATRMAGRIESILVREGDFVVAGQILAKMQIDTLQAQRAEAEAGRQQALHGVAAAQAQVVLREADVVAMRAQVTQREAELDAAKRRFVRSETLSNDGALSMQQLDDDRARLRSAEAAVTATRAQVTAALASVEAAKAQMIGAQSGVKAAEATLSRIEADLRDSELKAPRAGRVQVRVAQPGEVLSGGGRVLNLLDLSDVYMTFFVPETAAGRIAIGSEVRIVLDAAPDTTIPASVSFIASQAQFTPKTVETASERQKLMFRVRAQIPPSLLQRHLEQVKTGVPGVAWLKLDPQAPWPQSLAIDPALLDRLDANTTTD